MKFNLWICLGILLSPCPLFADAHEPARPNIVIILVDDMGYSDIGCYGGEIDTPNLDRLAAGGLRFTQFYNSGRCCPTRASLMTGLHPHQVGIGHMTEPPERPLGIQGAYQGYLNDNCTTIAEVLKGSDYHTLMSGKWHLGQHSREVWPCQRGFDRYYGCVAGGFNYFKPGGNRRMTLDNELVRTDDDFYATDDLTDMACLFLTQVTETDDKPFFLYLAYNAPHWPLNSKWEEYLKYKGKYSEGWNHVMQRRLAKQKEIGLWPGEITPAPHVGPEWDSLNEQQRVDQDAIMAAYAGCIDSIDQNVGKLLAHLEALNKRDNTIIFFLSDNGSCQEGGKLGSGNEAMIKNPPLETTAGVRLGLAWANASNTPFRLYKHFVHEGGACTPMIVSWPEKIASELQGKFVRQVAHLPDFMATCLELSGAKYPRNIPSHHGKTLLPLLSGSQKPIHEEPLYFEHEGNASMRWGNWKLVREYRKPWELYDIANDRTEMNDLATTEQQRRDKMIGMWEAWATQHEVAFPERFNMYEHINKQRKKKQKRSKKANT